jgi:hypothetical protein
MNKKLNKTTPKPTPVPRHVSFGVVTENIKLLVSIIAKISVFVNRSYQLFFIFLIFPPRKSLSPYPPPSWRRGRENSQDLC